MSAYAPSLARDRIVPRLAASTALPVLVALVALLLIGYSQGRPGNDRPGDPAVFIKAGSDFAGNPRLLPPDPPVGQGTGYDGQFFFYLAQDPFLTGKVATRHKV